MVLQQGEEITIWGKASPKEEITGFFRGEIRKTKASNDGKWRLVFINASSGGPYNLKLLGKNTIELNNVFVGEVWFCSGQSNMGWPLYKSENGIDEIEKSQHDKIKLFNVKRSMSGIPTKELDPKNKWTTCNSKTTKNFSAVAYYFARELHKRLGVPIGLIHSSWGGSSIESWMNADDFSNDKSKHELLQKIKTLDLNKLEQEYKVAEKKYNLYLDEADLGTEQNWQSVNYDYSTWKNIQLPNVWRNTNLKNRVGVVWVSKSISLTAEDASNDLLLSFGLIDNEDITYFNGYKIGSIKKNDISRKYIVSKELLKKGKNVITVRIKNPLDIGGFRSGKDSLYLQTISAKISLAGTWKYRVGTNEINQPPDRVHPKYLPSSLYNAMLYPFFDFKIRGVIWYQGESNVSNPNEYSKLFPKMIQDWRKNWQKKIPFLFVQLPNRANMGIKLVNFREAQTQALNLDLVGMIPTIDIGDDYNVHPANKHDVGYRLAVASDFLVYNPKIFGHYPKIINSLTKSKSVLFYFDQTILNKGSSKIKGFEIFKDGVFVSNTEAQLLDNKTVAVLNSSIDYPIEIRYLWKDAPSEVSIYNNIKMPLPPFRKTINN
ncbi:MAG: sialate O-acetylesterase [Bacteroidota bacterium]|nr:sialate O-acetylesterase [Bacteroidota bacterium]